MIIGFVFNKLKRIIEGIENGRSFGKIVLELDLPLASGTIFVKTEIARMIMA